MTGICTRCGQPCTVVVIDFGIGEYEYGSVKGFDSRPAAVSNCCEVEAVDESGHVITLQGLRDDEFDPPMAGED